MNRHTNEWTFNVVFMGTCIYKKYSLLNQNIQIVQKRPGANFLGTCIFQHGLRTQTLRNHSIYLDDL